MLNNGSAGGAKANDLFTVWGDVNDVKKDLEILFQFPLFTSSIPTTDVFINTSGSLTAD